MGLADEDPSDLDRIVLLPPSIVEPAIGATIAWTGIENLWNPGPQRRFLLTFLMGLFHGFGFAGALALPVLLPLRRRAWWPRFGVPALSLLIAAAGLYWLLERSL